jgi:hypothetical protein
MKWTIAGAGLIVPMLVASTSVGAFPWAEHPGSVCKYYSIQDGDTFLSGAGGSGGGGNGTAIKNSDSSSHPVVCPIPRLFPTSWLYDPGVDGVVMNTTGTSWTNADCSFRATSWDGDDEWVASTPSLWVSGNNTQFGWGAWTIDHWASFAIYCGTMRPGGWIQNIQVSEIADYWED